MMAKSAKNEALDYQALSSELALLMSQLEQGDLDVDEAVTCYERALSLVGQLETYLSQAENRITELKAAHADVNEDD
jgi:exodeoxyribonuclease VII small subunit